MSGGGNILIGSNILNRQAQDFWHTYTFGVAFLVRRDKVLDVVPVGFFCLTTEMTKAGVLAHAIKELGRLW